MSTPLTVGKARLATVQVTNPDGSPNATAGIGVSTGNAATLRVTVNPTNPREIAIVGLAQSAGVAGVNIDLGEGIRTASELVVISAATVPVTGLSSISIGAFGPEVDPPVWA